MRGVQHHPMPGLEVDALLPDAVAVPLACADTLPVRPDQFDVRKARPGDLANYRVTPVASAAVERQRRHDTSSPYISASGAA